MLSERVPPFACIFFLEVVERVYSNPLEMKKEQFLNCSLCFFLLQFLGTNHNIHTLHSDDKAFYEEKLNIPEDMAIIGFDKVNVLNIIGMNISFINGPSIELGKIGMKMLLENLDKEKSREIKRVTILPELMLNGSEKYIGE